VPPPPAFPPESAWRPLLERALAEDLGSGDVTTLHALPAGGNAGGVIEARQALRACGLPLAEAAFLAVEPAIAFTRLVAEGEAVAPGQPLARLAGPVHGILAAERTALNFLGRLCGIATQVRRFVDAAAGTGAAIVDTRKTLPGWRVLDKYAVATGGGVNHRAGLFDAILVKDNHRAAAGGVREAVKAVRSTAPRHLWLQVEVECEEDAEAALETGADALLLDNRSPEEVARFVARFGSRTVLEASGGVTLATVRAFAETGVHRISIGALTHSAPAADVALELRPGGVRR
jgi:nicotinate-nucleotide pyrophosphorylase (carboxylating)